MTPTISIIIVSWNSRGYLKRGLDSIFNQNLEDIEIILIDNGSSDATCQFVRDNFPSVKVIRNEKNMGACFARNQGIRLAKGEYMIFMDCDAELDMDFLSNLKIILNDLPRNIGGLSPKIINRHSGRIFSCGLRISSELRVYDIGRDRPSQMFSRPFDIDGPNSCCAIFSKECLEAIKDKGYFDEDFFFLFEDADVALRLINKGYGSLFVPQLICFHCGNSSRTSRQKRRYLCFRNRLYMIFKNNTLGQLYSFLLRSFFYDFPRALHFFLTNRYSFLVFRDLQIKLKNEKSYNF
jgi:hypothetical protein